MVGWKAYKPTFEQTNAHGWEHKPKPHRNATVWTKGGRFMWANKKTDLL